MKNYHHLKIEDVLKDLDTSKKGLSTKKAKKRLEKYGENKLVESNKFSAVELFLNQFKNPLIYILFFALIISFLTGHHTDGWIILAVILISAIVGFFQEYKANTALAQLKDLITYKAKVIRDEKEAVVTQEKLVPGDIVLLSPGDKVPADSRLLGVDNLEVNEAPLTGESLPIEKHTKVIDEDTSMADRENMVYMGTVIVRGKAKAVIVATGSDTQMGRIASLVRETKEDATPLQKQLIYFGKIIGVLLIVINALIFGLGILAGKPFLEMFMTSVAMIVAAIPEGLLPAMTVILAIGMQRLAKQKGLIRKMLATETLGAVTVICSDKTGTLTKGEMRLAKIVTESKKITDYKEEFSNKNNNASYFTALKIGLLCNDATIENPEDKPEKWNIVGNPTEKALLIAGRATGIYKTKLEEEAPRVSEIPFESKYKYMVTAHKLDDGMIASYMKGAPEKVLEFCSFLDIEGKQQKLDKSKKEKIEKEYEKLTKKGLRVIAVAYKLEKNKSKSFKLDKDNLKDFVFVGLIGLKDPLRAEAKETIELCKSAGIRPVIVTGDHRLTTMAIVKDLGLEVSEKNVVTGHDMDQMSDEELSKKIGEISIFARVEPKHKIRIVEALQKNGEIVAMTGDGVNDAPALKKADIGVAVGSGTDVAKETADLVLLDDNFKTIVEAIRGGRGTFDNIRKVVLYLLSNSFKEVVLIGFSIILGLPLALLPVQILWIKMIEDSLPSMALAFDPVGKHVMSRAPRGSKEQILNKKLTKVLFSFIVISDTLLFIIFYLLSRETGNVAYAQTIAFVGLGTASRFYIFSIRELKQSIFSYNPFENKLVNWSTVFGFFMILIAIYVPFLNNILNTVPIGIKEWGILLSYGIATIGAYEIIKKLFISRESANRINNNN